VFWVVVVVRPFTWGFHCSRAAVGPEARGSGIAVDGKTDVREEAESGPVPLATGRLLRHAE
jgi:hypothetical protein